MALALLIACGPPSTAELSESVVRVEALPCGKTGVGSGSVVADDLVLTNAHIVAGSTDDVTVRTGEDLVLDAIVVGFDPERDLALLEVEGLDLPPVEIGFTETGTGRILARPGGVELDVLDAIIVKSFNATGDDIYGEGDVSRRALELTVDVVPGVSGAGVYDEDGRLVGVVFAESRQRDEVTYAVSGDEVQAFIEESNLDIRADTLRCR